LFGPNDRTGRFARRSMTSAVWQETASEAGNVSGRVGQER
jgi:hypothetical protein